MPPLRPEPENVAPDKLHAPSSSVFLATARAGRTPPFQLMCNHQPHLLIFNNAHTHSRTYMEGAQTHTRARTHARTHACMHAHARTHTHTRTHFTKPSLTPASLATTTFYPPPDP
jgi:hypothetical protein